MYSLTEANATRWRCCSLVCTLLRLRPALVASTHPGTRDLTEARHDVREHGWILDRRYISIKVNFCIPSRVWSIFPVRGWSNVSGTFSALRPGYRITRWLCDSGCTAEWSVWLEARQQNPPVIWSQLRPSWGRGWISTPFTNRHGPKPHSLRNWTLWHSSDS